MKIHLLYFLIICQYFNPNLYCNNKNSIYSQRYFIENNGQWDSEVLYMSSFKNQNIWIVKNGIVFEILQSETKNNSILFLHKIKYQSLSNTNLLQEKKKLTSIYKLTFLGSKFRKSILKDTTNKITFNYFTGPKNSKWINSVTSFSKLLLTNVYNNIDLCLHFEGNELRFDLIVHLNGKINNIQMQLVNDDLSNNINIINNEIRFLSVTNELKIGGLKTYQIIDEDTIRVKSYFKFIDNHIEFETENYNPQFDIIIDPLLFSTYVHGQDDDKLESVSISHNGDIFISGITTSFDFPTTNNAFKSNYGYYPRKKDYGFFAKLNSEGSNLDYCSFFGSDSENSSLGIKKMILKNNNIYLFGTVLDFNLLSDDFPTYDRSFQKNCKGKKYGNNNLFIIIFDSNGKKIINSTLFGCDSASTNKSGTLNFIDSQVDSLGNVYLLGSIDFMTAHDFPIIGNSFQKKLNGKKDAFILKFNSSLSDLQYSSFLGGSGNDLPNSFSISEENIVYIVGRSNSFDFPISKYSYQSSREFKDSSTYSGFVTILDLSYPEKFFSTFFPGNVIKIFHDKNGENIISGVASDSFPNPTYSYQSCQDCSDQIFISKLDFNLSSINCSALLGGSGPSQVNDMLVDNKSNVLLVGNTIASDFPIRGSFIQDSYKGTNLDFGIFGDAFICATNKELSDLKLSSYIGGFGWEEGKCIAVDSNGNIIIAGSTSSSDFPTTLGSFDPIGGNNSQPVYGDIFVSKFGLFSGINDTLDETPIILQNISSEYILISNSCKFFEIFNSLGSKIGSSRNFLSNSLNENFIRFDISVYPTGLYFIKCGNIIEKFIKI